MIILAPVTAFALLAPMSVQTSGTGWTMFDGVTHLDRTAWSIQFYDTNSRSVLTPHLKRTAYQLYKHTGVKFYVTTAINRTSSNCPGRTSSGKHRIVVRLDPGTARSYSNLCARGGAPDSSRVMLSGPGWKNNTRNGSHEVYRRNLVSHELGHSVGLYHPSRCALSGTDPLMCGYTWGGYSTKDNAHKYASYDIRGLKALVSNR